MASFFKKLDKLKPGFDMAYKVIMVLCKLMLIMEVVLATIMVVGRYVFKNQPPWCSELILTFMVYMSLLSAALALRRGAHIRMNAFDKYLPEKVLIVLDILAAVAVFAFAGVMLVQGYAYASAVRGTFNSLPMVPRSALFYSVPLAGLCMIIFQLEALVNLIKKLVVKEEDV